MRILTPLIIAALVATGCKTTSVTIDDEQANEEAKAMAAAGTTTVDAAKHFSMGAQALKGDEQGDLAKARSEFERAFKADPSFAAASYNLGVIAEKQGKLDEAVKHYRDAFEADPRMDLAVNNLGVILETSDQVADATALYKRALERNPETVHARLRLARIAHQADDHKNAARLAREALQFDGKSLGAYRLLARVYAEKKKNTLARLIAVRGQKLAEGDPELTYALAIVAANEREVAIARELLRKVIEKDPNHVEARVTLSELALNNRDWKTASSQLDELAKLAPSNPSVHNSLGLALKGQGKFSEAKTAYENAVAADASYTAAILNLGILQLRHLDSPADAKAHFDRYLDLSSEGGKKVKNLLAEANILIEAKVEEERAMEMAKQAEEEEKRRATEEAAAAAEAAKNAPPPADGSGDGDASEPTETADGETAPEPDPEVEPEPEPVAKPKPKPKRKAKRKPKPKPKPKPKAAPENDDEFFD